MVGYDARHALDALEALILGLGMDEVKQQARNRGCE
jgi:hypothetical protein